MDFQILGKPESVLNDTMVVMQNFFSWRLRIISLTTSGRWWRWIFWKRMKAVPLTIWSDNPYVEIGYSEYVQIQK